MKYKKFGIMTIFTILVTILSMPVIAQGAGLNPGATCTVSIEGVSSNGTVTTDLGISTTAVVDADGKLVFTLSSGIPTSASYNFLVVTATDGTTTRKAVIAAPAAGGSVNGTTDGGIQRIRPELILATMLENSGDRMDRHGYHHNGSRL